MADRKLSITITGDAKGAKKAVGDLDQALGKAEKSAKSSSSGIKSSLATMGIGAALFGAAKAFDESAKVAAQTEAVIKSTGNAANITADGVADLAGELSKKAGVDDEAIQSGSNLIATFKNIKNEAGEGNDIFNQTTEAALDMSVAMGTDMTSASMMLGKALNDPTAGLGKLAKAGVQFTDQQKEQIQTMQASGDTLGAQKIMLAELESQFGGSAEAQATAMGKAQVSIDNLAESLGGVLMPVVAKAADGLSIMADGLGALPQSMQTGVVVLGAAAIAWAKWGEELGSAIDKTKEFGSTLNKNRAAVGMAAGAIGVGALAFSLWQDEQAKAAAESAKWEASLKSMREEIISTGDAAADVFTRNQLADSFVEGADFADKYGLSLTEMSEAIAGGKDAWAAYTREQLAANPDAQRVGYNELEIALSSVGEQYGELTKSTKEQKEVNAELAESTGPLINVQSMQRGASEAQEQAMLKLRDASKEAGDAIRTFYDDATSGLESTIEVERAIDDLTATLIENKGSFDINEEAGRANTEALIDAKDAAVGAALAIREQTGSSDAAADSLQGYAKRLQDSMRAAGATEAEIALMTATMKLTPKDIRTTVHSNATAQEGAFGRLSLKIYAVPAGKNVNVTVTGAQVVENALSGVQNAIRRVQAVAAVRLSLGSIPGFAGGTDSAPGGLAYVHKDELIDLPRGSKVHTAAETRALMSGGPPRSFGVAPVGGPMGGGNVTYITVNVAGQLLTEGQLIDQIAGGLRAKQARTPGRKILAGTA